LDAIAANDALLGRRDDALAHIEQAFANGWRQNPAFPMLFCDPRFEKLRNDQNAHLAGKNAKSKRWA
jgi:hypothetical protein